MIEAREIEAELLAFLQREVFAPQVVVTPETDLVAAGFDSMSLVRLLLFVETTWGLWVPEKEIDSLIKQPPRPGRDGLAPVA